MGKTSLVLVSASITTYGPTALGFLKEQSEVDVFAYPEIHLLAGDVPVARKKLTRLNCPATGQLPRQQGRVGHQEGR